jgi:Mn-containing catalase
LGSLQAGKEFWHQSILRAIRNVIHLLLFKSLAEEENADQLLNQIARSLMSVAKTAAVIERATIDGAE